MHTSYYYMLVECSTRMFVRYTPRMAWWVRPVQWYVPGEGAPDPSPVPTPILRRRQLNPTLGR